MALVIGGNFDYRAQEPNFERDRFATLEAMKAFPETSIDDGHISYCVETDKHYKYLSSNPVDGKTGKWREFTSGKNLKATGALLLSDSDDNSQTITLKVGSGLNTDSSGKLQVNVGSGLKLDESGTLSATATSSGGEIDPAKTFVYDEGGKFMRSEVTNTNIHSNVKIGTDVTLGHAKGNVEIADDVYLGTGVHISTSKGIFVGTDDFDDYMPFDAPINSLTIASRVHIGSKIGEVLIRGEVRIGPQVTIKQDTHLDQEVRLGRGVKIGSRVIIGTNLKQEYPESVLIGTHVTISEAKGILIGTEAVNISSSSAPLKGLAIASNVCIGFGVDDVTKDQDITKAPVIIGTAVQLGNGVRVGGTTKIGGGVNIQEHTKITHSGSSIFINDIQLATAGGGSGSSGSGLPEGVQIELGSGMKIGTKADGEYAIKLSTSGLLISNGTDSVLDITGQKLKLGSKFSASVNGIRAGNTFFIYPFAQDSDVADIGGFVVSARGIRMGSSTDPALYIGTNVFIGERLQQDEVCIKVGALDSQIWISSNVKIGTGDAWNGFILKDKAKLLNSTITDSQQSNTSIQDVDIKPLNDAIVVTDKKTNESYVLGHEIEDLYAYGVEIDKDTKACTRIGNMTYHKTLPIQSTMKGCLLNDDGEVTKYLNPQTWEEEVRDGSQGQVMVEMVSPYWKFYINEKGNMCVKQSMYPLRGYVQLVPSEKVYCSAYEASLQRSTQKLCSVVNTTADYRGGNNNSTWDSNSNSLLGKPVTNISLTNFRAYARKRKPSSTEWNCYNYNVHKILYWMFVIEYANLNSQAAFNSELTSEGFKQGGLGAGVTDIDNAKWYTFNNLNPFIPCGYTDSLGNSTGVVLFKMPTEYDTNEKVTNVPRYRGIENPFGHVWKWTDGIQILISADESKGGNGLSKLFTCSDPSKFNDANQDGYIHAGNCARSNGYIKDVVLGENGEVLPASIGGSSTSGFADYFYTSVPASGESLRGVLFGGNALSGANAGFVSAYSHYVPSAASAGIGSRLCFLPNIVK